MGDHLCTYSSHSGDKKPHDWVVEELVDLFRTTRTTKTEHVIKIRGRLCGDIDLTTYLTNTTGPGLLSPFKILPRINVLLRECLGLSLVPSHVIKGTKGLVRHNTSKYVLCTILGGQSMMSLYGRRSSHQRWPPTHFHFFTHYLRRE
jgi:hypothetical protein